MKVRSFALFATVALLAAGSGSVFAQETRGQEAQENQRVDSAMDAQKAQHAKTEAAIGQQREEGQEMRQATNALKEQRADCRHDRGEAAKACHAKIRQDEAQKRADVADFRAAQDVHQDDAAQLKADQARTKTLRQD